MDFFRLILRFITEYKGRITAYVLMNFIASVFSVFSFIALIPLIQLLFGLSDETFEYMTFKFFYTPKSEEVYAYTFKRHKKDPMFWTAIGTLLVLPVYKISVANDFIMRGSMAPAFLICLYSVMFVTDNFEMCRSKKLELKKAIIGRLVLITALVAAYVPANYILYTALISYQMHFTDEVNYEDEIHKIGSFGNIIEYDELEVIEKQFYVYDYEDTPFYKYFAK